jgi:hypothetical protein
MCQHHPSWSAEAFDRDTARIVAGHLDQGSIHVLTTSLELSCNEAARMLGISSGSIGPSRVRSLNRLLDLLPQDDHRERPLASVRPKRRHRRPNPIRSRQLEEAVRDEYHQDRGHVRSGVQGNG